MYCTKLSFLGTPTAHSSMKKTRLEVGWGEGGEGGTNLLYTYLWTGVVHFMFSRLAEKLERHLSRLFQ